MERFSAWLYERTRPLYPAPAVAVAMMFAVAAVAPGAIGATFWFDLAFGEVLSLTAVSAGVVAVASFLAAMTMEGTGHIGMIRAWARGDQTVRANAWIAVHRGPVVGIRRTLIVLTPLQLAVIVPAFQRWTELDGTYAYVVIGVAVQGVVVAGAGAAIVGLILLLRPVTAELSIGLDPGFTGAHRTLGVATRIMIGAAVSVMAAGLLTAAAAIQSDDPVTQMALALGVSTLAAAFQVFIFRVGYVTTLTSPLRDLANLTTRVSKGDYDIPAPITTSDEFGDLVASFNAMQAGLRERQRLQAAFGSYVDPGLTSRLLSTGSELFDGEEVEATVLFADVRNFTPFAEKVGARDAVARLNELFDVLVPILHEHGGHANKFLGDGLMAAFGVLERVPDHATQAVSAALRIQQHVHDRFGHDQQIGIGINTGPVIAGTIGGGGKLEFTLIGDTVNVAAMVERLTRQTGDEVLITRATLDRVTDMRGVATPRGSHQLKGREGPVEVHAVDLVDHAAFD